MSDRPERYRAQTEAIWRRLEEQHGESNVIDGAWNRGLKPKQIVANVLRAADHEGGVEAREAGETFLSAWDDWRMGRSTTSDLARAVGALRAALGGQS